VSSHHDYDQDLVELALGQIAEPRRSELLSHLTGCLVCRETYADAVGAIDATTPAAPEAQPPAGFDLRVLAAMGIDPDLAAGEPPGPVRRATRRSSPRMLLAAAAVLVVAAAGFVGATTVLDDRAVEVPAAAEDALAGGTALQTGDGEAVGAAAVAWMYESRVLVVSVDNAPVGVPYTCRVRLSGGGTKVLGHWEASASGGGVWVMRAPQGDLNTLELVTDSGHVWSAAQLP
jgi:hypothetical protein